MTNKEMVNKFGIVNFEGSKYILTQDAYCDNYMDTVRYYAHAIKDDATDIDSFGEQKQYVVAWDLKDDVNYDELQDESDACDWDAAAEVTEC